MKQSSFFRNLKFYGWIASCSLTLALAMTEVGKSLTFIVWKYLPETNYHLDKTATKIKVVIKNYLIIVTHLRFIGYTILSSLAFAGFICYVTVTPFLLENKLGVSAVAFGWLSIFLSASILISQYLNSRLVMKKGNRVMLSYGVGLMVIAGLTMLLFALFGVMNTWVIVIPAMIFNCASGFVFSNAMAGAFEYFG